MKCLHFTKYINYVLLGLVLISLYSCSASKPNPVNFPIAGQSPVVRWDSEHTLILYFGSVDSRGSFAELELGKGLGIKSENWVGDEDSIHLSVVHAGKLHVGAVTQPGKRTSDTSVTIELERTAHKRTADAPDGASNTLIDLTATGQGNGNYELAWTEVNRGDYDFNGVANISDLVGIALHLGKSYDTADPDAPLLTEYWVDGNQDGLVSIADISTLGQNFGNQVAGYAVSVNGGIVDPDEDGFTILRADSTPRQQLPNQYATQYAGEVSDLVNVVPRDGELGDGISTEPETVPQFSFGLNIDMQLPDTEFYDLDGSGLSGPFGPGRFAVAMLDVELLEPLRRILPGEIPSSAEIGNSISLGQTAEVFDLPLDKPVAMALAFLPTRDLGTEEEIAPPDGTPVSSFWELDPVVAVYLLPAGAQLATQDMSVNLSVSKIDEFKVIGTSTFQGVDGLLGRPLVQEYDDMFLSRNTENDETDYPADFINDVRMSDGKPDQEPWGITVNLLRRTMLEAQLSGTDKADFEMNAKIDIEDSINLSEGYVIARVQQLNLDGVPVDEGDLPVDSVVIKFTEISEFLQPSLTPGNFDNVSPTKMSQEMFISLNGRLHRNGGLENEDVYWVDELIIPLL